MKNKNNNYPLVIPYSETHKIRSEINNVEYRLFVILPSKYEADHQYPVIFTTDPILVG